MEWHFINYNPQNSTPPKGFYQHDNLKAAKDEAVKIMRQSGDEIYIYKLVGVVKPIQQYDFIEATDPIPF